MLIVVGRFHMFQFCSLKLLAEIENFDKAMLIFKKTLKSINKISCGLIEVDCNSMYYLSGSLPKSIQKSTQNGGSILNAPIAWLCHAEHVLQTGNVAHLWAFHVRRLSD